MLKDMVRVTCSDCGRTITTRASTVPRKCGDCLRTNLEVEPIFESRPATDMTETRVAGRPGRKKKKSTS